MRKNVREVLVFDLQTFILLYFSDGEWNYAAFAILRYLLLLCHDKLNQAYHIQD